jgi:peptidyl-prolyl cis-trans isomerase SurA
LQITKSIQLNKRKRDLGYAEVKPTMEKLLSLADTSLQKGHWNAITQGAAATETLFSMGSSSFNVRSFYQFVAERQRPSALPPATYFTQLLDQFVEEKINEQEDEKLQRENGDYRNLLNEYREGILLFSIMEKEIWSRGSEDSVGQRTFYERNKSKYTAGERVHARVLGTPDASLMAEIKEKISRGDTLKEADLRKFKVAMNPRAFEKGENKAIDQITWAVGRHETEVEGTYYLVDVDRLLPAGIKTFEETRAAVISDYQTELEDRWIAQLREKYPVKVNKKVLKKVIANLKTA